MSILDESPLSGILSALIAALTDVTRRVEGLEALKLDSSLKLIAMQNKVIKTSLEKMKVEQNEILDAHKALTVGTQSVHPPAGGGGTGPNNDILSKRLADVEARVDIFHESINIKNEELKMQMASKFQARVDEVAQALERTRADLTRRMEASASDLEQRAKKREHGVAAEVNGRLDAITEAMREQAAAGDAALRSEAATLREVASGLARGLSDRMGEEFLRVEKAMATKAALAQVSEDFSKTIDRVEFENKATNSKVDAVRAAMDEGFGAVGVRLKKLDKALNEMDDMLDAEASLAPAAESSPESSPLMGTFLTSMGTGTAPTGGEGSLQITGDCGEGMGAFAAAYAKDMAQLAKVCGDVRAMQRDAATSREETRRLKIEVLKAGRAVQEIREKVNAIGEKS
jgi:hypothetical protein